MGVRRPSDGRQPGVKHPTAFEESMLEFRALGTTDLRDLPTNQGFDGLIARPKLLALFAYLLLDARQEFRPRDELVGVFWPDLGQQQARHALRQALYELRVLLGEAVVVSHGDQLGIDRELVKCDVHSFESAIGAEDFGAALGIYSGDLLPGLYVPGCPDFEDWLQSYRRRLRALAVLAVEERVVELMLDGDFSGAVVHLQRGLTWEPYAENLLRHLLHCRLRLGDRSTAIREYETFRSRLFSDLAVNPSEETEALIEAVRGAGSSVPSGQPRPSGGLSDSHSEAESPRGVREPGRSLPQRRVATGSALVALLAIGGILVNRDRAADSLALDLESDRVLVMPFINHTGDPELDPLGPAAADWIVRGLDETDLVRAVLTMGEEQRKNNEAGNLTDAVRSLAERNRAALAVVGSYQRQGDSLVFETQIIDTTTGELLREIPRIKTPTENPLSKMDELRRRTTGSVATVTDPRLRSWAGRASQPPSYAAYLLYDQGLEALLGARSAPFSLASGAPRSGLRVREAAGYFYRAGTLDSGFNMALLWAAQAHFYGGDRVRSDSLSQALNEKRDQLTQFERALLDGLLARIRGDLSAAYRAYSRAVAMAPGSVWTYDLAQVAYVLNRPGEASRLLSAVSPDLELMTQREMYWILLTKARHRSGDHEQELGDARRGRRVLPGSARLRRAELRALGALGRVGDLSPRDHNEAFALVEELLRHGHEAAADAMIGDFLTRYDPAQDSLHLNNAAYWLERAGRPDESRAILEQLVGRDPENWWAWRRLAEIAAKRGDRQKALEIALSLQERQASAGARGRMTYYRAIIAAHLGENERATQLIRQAWDQGWAFDRLYLHSTPYLPRSLRDYPAFQELMRPEG
jgi:DNA-binding SARP family transcriptional activator/TolB-like protein